MKIAHFTSGIVNPASDAIGSHNVAYHVAHEQARLGHDVVSVQFRRTETPYPSAATAAELLVLDSPTVMGFRLPSGLADALDRGDLAPAVAHLHGVYVPTMIAVARLLRSRHIPYVVSAHGSLTDRHMGRGRVKKLVFKQLLANTYLDQALFVHVHSALEAEDARGFGVKSPVVVVEQGVEEVGPRLSGWSSDGTLRLLYLGRLDVWQKGLDLLLEAFHDAVRTGLNAELRIIGADDGRGGAAEVDRLIRELELGEVAELLPPVFEVDAKFAEYQRADLVVVPSRHEGAPLVVFEALAAGTPVLVTPGTNVAELVDREAVGLTAEFDRQALASAMRRAAEMPELPELGARARELAQRYTWRATAERIVDQYAAHLGIG